MNRLSPGLNIAWRIAALEAMEKRSVSIDITHFILGLLSFDKVPIENAEDQYIRAFLYEKKAFYDTLAEFRMDITATRRALRNSINPGTANYSDNMIHRSEECKKILDTAEHTSGQYLTSLDFFAASVTSDNQPIRMLLAESNIDIKELYKKLVLTSRSMTWQPDIDVFVSTSETAANTTVKYKFLQQYGKDLNSMAEKSLFSVFEGRQGEIRQLVTTLGKKAKNNPIIIGEPGVGKSALVEGLAMLIYEGKVLPGRRIFQVSASSLVAGTKFRGEFEERLLNLIDEALRNPEVILFFDEIHQFVGAGGAEGGLDAANILKPALGREGFTCIGATTIGEYHKYIEKDPAFTRRFQKIIINEPTAKETIEILEKIRPSLEKFHNVVIADDAIKATVDLCIRYEPDKCLPDKAIDLLDESCSAVSNKTITIEALNQNKEPDSIVPQVDNQCIARLLSRRTGIPLSRIAIEEAHKYAQLGQILKNEIIGQDDSIDELVNYLRISKSGIGDPSKPLGVFLFIGPSGVGKTYLAKRLAAALFLSESNLVRFDMSEYMEMHSVSKLIGAPPGYVMSEEEGQLISKLRNKPYSVILFDEIDKAHPKIMDILLQLFDDGRITDNKGRLIDGRNAIFILTSNLISSSRKHVGFGAEQKKDDKNRLEIDLLKMFRPEFLNRINKILLFNSLTKQDVVDIIKNEISLLCELLVSKFNINIAIKGDPSELIFSRCQFELFGARSISREISQLLKEPISQYIIECQAQGKIIQGQSLSIETREQKLEFTFS